MIYKIYIYDYDGRFIRISNINSNSYDIAIFTNNSNLIS